MDCKFLNSLHSLDSSNSSPFSFVILKLPAMPPSDDPRTDEIREIKQIATLATGEIVALCSDSTVWIYAGSNWRKLPNLGETP